MFRKNDRHSQQTFFSNMNELPEKLQKRLYTSWANTFYEEVFSRIDEEPYAVLYAEVPSRPNVPVNVLVGLEILKAGYGWSDEEMYETYCFNLQVRHALGLQTLGEGYVGLRTIYDFRARLTAHMQEKGVNLFAQTFEEISGEQLVEFNLKSSRQRVDSTQIGSNIREMSRLQLLVEVLQRVHRMLSGSDKAKWAEEFVPYLKGSSGQYTYQLKGKDAHRPHLEAIGDLMARLIAELPAVYHQHETWAVLQRVFDEHFNQDDEGNGPKDDGDLRASSLQSPDDPSASYRNKRGEGYVGYVANVTETSDTENKFQLILKVQVEPNTTDDAAMLADIVPELSEKHGLKVMDADGGYGSPEVDEVMAKYGVELHQTALRGRSPNKDTFNLADCELEFDSETDKPTTVTTAAGERLKVEAGRKSHRFILRPADDKAIYFSQQDVAVALRRKRCARLKLSGKNPRAAVEATVGAIKRPFGNDKTPVRGKLRVGMMVIGSALMVNLRRIQRFRTKQQEAGKNQGQSDPGDSLFSFFKYLAVLFVAQFRSVIAFSALQL